MNKSFKLSSQDELERCINYIRSLNLDKPLSVEIKPYRKNRTLAQNKLMWMWFKIIGDDLGYTENEVYDEMTELYLPKSLRTRFNGEKYFKRLGTSDLDTKQFTVFLDQVDRFACDMGIILPKPLDLYYQAMGIKG